MLVTPPLMFGPNISGSFWAVCGGTGADGAFALNTFKKGHITANLSGADDTFDFQASRSSNLYGASSTVQPPSLRFLPLIKF